MKRYSLIAAATSLFLLPVSVFAAGYGAAGCGLGSMVLGSKPGIHQVFAATTNGTFGSQTLGITFGTSNCGDHGLVKISKEREVFAQENYTSLVKEMAQGKGENLSTLASLYQCPAAKHQEFGTMVQEKFDSLVASDQTTSTELLSQLENQLTRHPTLASSCNIKQAALD
ncbi:DUF3015 domain-containing protein [Nitrosospira lacus]|uniref:Orotate phosphoribosyltransferase n=1 Tax=Nitrosospira lacus TaxID=1288494 RepID=A0A1W6SR51_9PROT|nr:DUF3015 domain-containing protein [Nitrosospira lacus]ARO88252.1 DUF3015 domain-containing protein [Nitrosospira lacus]